MPDTPIEMPVADEILLMSALDRQDEVIQLIDDSPLEAWYGIPIDRLRSVLTAIPPERIGRSHAVRAFRLLLNGPVDGPASPGGSGTAASPGGSGTAASLGMLAAQMFDARLRGRPLRASQLAAQLGVTRDTPNALFDSTVGWHAFLSIQSGITRMLSGEFAEALDAFASATRAAPPLTLSVLLRDAYTKAALVHALFGDPRTARNMLHSAADVPLTASWAEPIVTAHAEIAATLLDDEPLAGIDRLERMHPAVVGEMWPFWLDAQFRLYVRADRADEGAARIGQLAEALTGGAAEAYPATVVPIARAVADTRRGDLGRARQHVAEASPDQTPTVLANAFGAIAEHRLEEAIGPLVALAPRTRALAQLEATRTVLLAWALLRRDQPDDAAECLRRLARPGSARPLMVLPAELNEFAQDRLGWAPNPHTLPSTTVAAPPALTPREKEILVLLAAGMSRSQIAEKLFISTNTVKTQVSSLYRKLATGNRADALLAADRLGLF